jgi:NAD(P)-dependent dehydrogenase (short-subunit alcohol dehydrogenase family)
MSTADSARWKADAKRTVLITGTGSRAQCLADTLRSAGHRVTFLDPATVVNATASTDALPPSIDLYLQLPTTVQLRGDTLVARVRSFLADGLLARFDLVEKLLPLLVENASVVLVAGNVAGGSPVPDDRSSRLALLRVLAHATRAELIERKVRVQVVAGNSEDSEILDCLFDAEEQPAARAWEETQMPASREYQDWRIEMMGLMTHVSA